MKTISNAVRVFYFKKLLLSKKNVPSYIKKRQWFVNRFREDAEKVYLQSSFCTWLWPPCLFVFFMVILKNLFSWESTNDYLMNCYERGLCTTLLQTFPPHSDTDKKNFASLSNLLYFFLWSDYLSFCQIWLKSSFQWTGGQAKCFIPSCP